MKVILWVAKVIAFTIYVALISFGLFILANGFAIHSWELEAFGMSVLILAMWGIANHCNDKARETIDG